MSQVSLKYQETIANGSIIDALPNQYSIVVSPSERYIALLSQSSITVFDASNKTIVWQRKMEATSVLFDINDGFLYALSTTSLMRISLKGGESTLQSIIASNVQNQLGSLAYSPDCKVIYFANHSKLQAYASHNTSFLVNSIHDIQSCPVDAYFIDPSSQLLITSSYDCKLCAYSIATKLPQLVANNSVAQCRIGSMAFGNGYAFLTQDSITTKLPQLITLSLPNLTILSYTNQSSSGIPLHLVQYNNYILSYATNDQDVWVYKDSLASKPQRVTIPSHVLAMGASKQNKQIYILGNDNGSVALSTFSLNFNCSSVSGTINSTTPFASTCNCKSGKLFDSSKQACSRSQCLNTEASPCKCPYQQTFDPFSLNCQLDCSQVYNTYSKFTFGNPARCSCNDPFLWNSELSDCSFLDCSLIPNTIPANISQRCACKDTLIWDDASISCKQQSSNSTMIAGQSGSSPVGLILGIIFLFLVIIVSAIIFYVKKYRKSEEDMPKTFEYQHSPTPRPLSFENMARTDTELGASSDRKSEGDRLRGGA